MSEGSAEDLIYLDNNATTAMDPLVMDAVNLPITN